MLENENKMRNICENWHVKLQNISFHEVEVLIHNAWTWNKILTTVKFQYRINKGEKCFKKTEAKKLISPISLSIKK